MSFFNHLPKLGYSRDLHKHLRGLSVTTCDSYNGDAVYQITSIVIIIVSLLLMANYYYGLFNNPRYTRRRIWLIHLFVAATISGTFAYHRAANGLPQGRHCDQISFSVLDCALFGFTAAIYTCLLCFLFSLLLKWKSIANKKIPF
jgi:hypothetical protein